MTETRLKATLLQFLLQRKMEGELAEGGEGEGMAPNPNAQGSCVVSLSTSTLA